MMPLTCAFRGDAFHLLVVVEETDTMAQVAEKVAAHAVGLRVAAQPAPMRVRFKEQVQPDHLTVAEAEIRPMDFVEVFYDA